MSTNYRRIERLQEYDLLEERLQLDRDGHHYNTYRARLERVETDLVDGEFRIDVTYREANAADRFTELFEGFPLVMLALAFPGRHPRKLKLYSVGLFVLIIVQYATAIGYRGSVVAALRPVNAQIIFWIAVLATHRSWRALGRAHRRENSRSPVLESRVGVGVAAMA